MKFELVRNSYKFKQREKEKLKGRKNIIISKIDYSSNDKEAKLFFKTVQNKIHYGVHGHTAAEVIGVYKCG